MTFRLNLTIGNTRILIVWITKNRIRVLYHHIALFKRIISFLDWMPKKFAFLIYLSQFQHMRVHKRSISWYQEVAIDPESAL